MPFKKASSGTVPTEKLSVEEAVQRIHDMCLANTQRLMELEKQFNQMLEDVAEKNEKMDRQLGKMERQISEIRMGKTTPKLEDKHKFDQIEQQSDKMTQPLHALIGEEQVEPEIIHDTPKMMTKNHATSNRPVLDIGEYSNYSKKVEPSYPRNHSKMTKSSTAMVQKPIVPPTFSSTYSESPNDFLIRLQKYAEAVDGWDQTTLLLGISQFLQDAALDWYRHLSASRRCPRIWSDFTSLFLSRFNPPLEIARRARYWHQCEQMDDETIDDFFFRLRRLWAEQKPEESESDFTEHLLCKIRNEIFEMMTVPPNPSTEDVLLEAQRVEEALYPLTLKNDAKKRT